MSVYFTDTGMIYHVAGHSSMSDRLIPARVQLGHPAARNLPHLSPSQIVIKKLCLCVILTDTCILCYVLNIEDT